MSKRENNEMRTKPFEDLKFLKQQIKEERKETMIKIIKILVSIILTVGICLFCENVLNIPQSIKFYVYVIIGWALGLVIYSIKEDII